MIGWSNIKYIVLSKITLFSGVQDFVGFADY
jgi:hypothetical protein